MHSRSIALEANAHHARGHHTGGPKADHALTFNLDHSSGAAHGFKHTSSCHPLLPHKLSIQANTGCHSHLTNLLLISGQVHLRYPSVGLGTCPQPIITDQITDQNTPYCGELAYAVCNDIRVLAVIRCSSREPIPPRCAIDQQTRAVFW